MAADIYVPREVQGDRPYSFWKIFFFVLAIVLILVLVALVFGRN